MKRGRPGDWQIPGTVVSNAKGYYLSAMLWSWRLLLCYAHADGPQSTVSSPLLKISQHKCLHRGPVRSISSMRGAVCSFLATLHAVFAKLPRTRNDQAENGSNFWPRKIQDSKHWNVVKCHKKNFEPGPLHGVLLKGHIDPSYLYIVSTR